MGKIFVRERRQVGTGAGQPRFRIVASEGLDMRVYVPHMRRMELDQLAAATGAEIVFLPRGEQEGDGQPGSGQGGSQHGGGHRHGEGHNGGRHGGAPHGGSPQMQDQD